MGLTQTSAFRLNFTVLPLIIAELSEVIHVPPTWFLLAGVFNPDALLVSLLHVNRGDLVVSRLLLNRSFSPNSINKPLR